MIIYLRRFTRWSQVLAFDISKQQVEVLSNKFKTSDIKTSGFYDEVNNIILSLFSLNQSIYLSISNKLFKIDNDYTIQYSSDKKKGNLLIKNNNITILNIFYPVDEFNLASSLYYSPEQEDENFGLWLSNVLNDDSRKQIFIEQNSL